MDGGQVGLTLGKFSPLHRGHQLVIETALAEMDRVIVLVYDSPETTRCPLPVRAAWIRDLYPAVEVLEAWDGPTTVGDTPEIRQIHDDYLRRCFRGRRICRFYSSEFYGDHVSRALGAANRVVDPDRRRFPVSGTAVRRDPFRYRRFIPDRVYRDLIVNVVFLGAPSTGKTTLAERMAQVRNTVWMAEYGREYWERHQKDRRLTPEQLVDLAEIHLRMEEEQLLRADRFLFTDTNALTTRLFSLHYHGFAAPELETLADRAASRYDLVFVCGDDIPYEDTPDRSGEANRRIFQKQVVADLAVRKIPYFRAAGALTDRVAAVRRTMDGFEKYGNLLDRPRIGPV